MKNKPNIKRSFTVHIYEQDKINLFKAAEIEGKSVSEFVRNAVQEKLEKMGYMIPEEI